MNATTTVRMMSQMEAEQCAAKIHQSLKTCREQLYQLYLREGWRALGYSSMSDCMEKEFEKSRRHMARELEAAKVEVNVGPIGPIGSIPESHLRPLTRLSPEDQRRVYADVQADPEAFDPDLVGKRQPNPEKEQAAQTAQAKHYAYAAALKESEREAEGTGRAPYAEMERQKRSMAAVKVIEAQVDKLERCEVDVRRLRKELATIVDEVSPTRN